MEVLSMEKKEPNYHLLRIRITEAIRLAQDAHDDFIEYLLSLSLAETEERFKAIEVAKLTKVMRAEA
jgi:hypothetical protein